MEASIALPAPRGQGVEKEGKIVRTPREGGDIK